MSQTAYSPDLTTPAALVSGSAEQLAVGRFGGILIDDADSHDGNWGVLYALTDTEFDSVTGNIVGDFNGVELPAGTALYGLFSEVELASGSIIAYNA